MRWTEINQVKREYDWDKEVFNNEFTFLDYDNEMIVVITTDNDDSNYNIVSIGAKGNEAGVYIDPEYSDEEQEALLAAILNLYIF